MLNFLDNKCFRKLVKKCKIFVRKMDFFHWKIKKFGAKLARNTSKSEKIGYQ